MDKLKNFIKTTLKKIKQVIKSNKKLYIFLWKIRVFFINSYLKFFKNFRSIEIETTPICNRKCSFCPITNVAQDGTPKKVMSEELFNKIIKELKELRFKGDVCLSSYGEPLLDKRLAGFAKKVKEELGVKIIIFTNGDFLTTLKFRELLLAGIDTFFMSQHDTEPSTAIKKLLAEISPSERKHLVFGVINEESSLNNRGGTVEVKTLQPLVICPIRKMYVRADGAIRLCCNDYFREVRLGNVNETKLIDIWNSLAYKKIRKELEKNIFNQRVCKKCQRINQTESNKIIF